MEVKQYESYKDSDVEWIGEIPNEWIVSSLKWLITIKSGEFLSSIEVNDTGAFPVYGGNGILGFSDKKNVRKSHIIIGRVGALCGNVNINVNDSWITDNALFISKYDESKIEFKYLYYALMCMNLNQYANKNAQPLISGGLVKSKKIPIPPIGIQKNICKFIDKSICSIEELISQKQSLITLLQEQRQAIITEAVTKGLNPDVKMKDSGVEWIGEIPEHWSINPLFTMFADNKVKNIGNTESNVLSLSYGKIVKRNVGTNEGLLPESFETYQIVQPGFIILRLTDLQNDKRSLRCGLVKEQGIITSAYTGLNPTELVNSNYAYYLLHSYDVMKVFYGLGNGVRQSMNYSDLKRLPILLPKINEQKEIADYLDNKISEIDILVKNIEHNLKKLTEYKQSLITEVVTGKIDVRDYAEIENK